MTTENDELEDRILQNGKSAEKQNVFPTGFQDPSGLYPRADYFYKSSLNQASLGTKRNDLLTNGGIPTLPKEDLYQDKIIRDAKASGQYNSAAPSTYPHNQVI